MSDSEEDFASADEGEVAESPPKAQKQQSDGKTTKTKPEKQEDSNIASVSAKTVEPQQAQASSAKSKQTEPAKGKKKGKKQDKKGKKGPDRPADSKQETKSENKATVKTEKQIPVEKQTVCDSGTDSKETNCAKSENSGENAGDSSKNDCSDEQNSNDTESSAKIEKSEKTEPANTEDISKDVGELNQSGDANADPATPENPARSAAGDSNTDQTKDQASMLKSPSSQCISRPEPDHTDAQESVLAKLSDAATEKKSGWGWGWGSSLLNVASSSVSTFTSQVGEGFHTVMETVESSLNVPGPEEMAERNSKAKSDTQPDTKEKLEPETKIPSDFKEPESQDGSDGDKTTEAGKQTKEADSDSWFSAWGVSNITKIVENTSKSIVTGGLDVLETIGKKTFDVINEHDPGLKKTLGLVRDRGDRPNLSSTLREAKEDHEARVQQEKETEEARKSHFGALFDEFQGLAHLEALEMLSNQSEKQVNTLLGAFSPAQIGSIKPQLIQIKQHFEMEEDEEDEEEVTEQDFVKLVTDTQAEIKVPMTPDKLIKVQERISACIKKVQDTENAESLPSPKEVHQQAVQSLAEFTSRAMEHFHKLGELVLLNKAELTDFTNTGKQLHCLTKILCNEVGIMAAKFTEALNKREESEGMIAINQLVTNIYLEASNSSSYIQDGFQLLLPVMQQATMEHCSLDEQ